MSPNDGLQPPAVSRTKCLAAIAAHLVIAINTAGGATYYIDAQSGKNDWNGTTPDRAWRDFSNVNAMTLQPGDKVLLRRGCVWNQLLLIKGQGNAQRRIVIGAYGEGHLPTIRRDGLFSQLCAIVDTPSFMDIRDLHLSHAGAGLLVKVMHRACRSVTISGVIGREFNGLYWHKGKKEFNAHGLWQGSYGIYVAVRGKEGRLEDLTIRECEVFDSACGLALDGGWTSRKGINNALIDRCFFRDNVKPDHSSNSIWLAYCENTRLTRTVIDRGAHSARMGTTALFLAVMTDFTMRDCAITRTPDAKTFDRAGVSFEHSGKQYMIARCTFIDNAGAAIQFLRNPDGESVQDAIIRKCRFIGNHFTKTPAHPQRGQVLISAWKKNNRPTVTVEDNHYVNRKIGEQATVFFSADLHDAMAGVRLRNNVEHRTQDALWRALPLNDPPTVDAGEDIEVVGDTAVLKGVARDSNLPQGNELRMQWSLLAGPSAVRIKSPQAPETQVRLPTIGAYLLHLRADDGGLFRSDVVCVVRRK